MKNNRKRLFPVLVILVTGVIIGIYYFLQNYSIGNESLVTGTIEANEVNLGVVMGGTAREVYVSEGEEVYQNQLLASVRGVTGAAPGYTEKVRSPINGIVLTRAIEPGEVAMGGSTLFVVADLHDMSLTVYVPEDRYGQISLGGAYPVTVDSFPGQVFWGTVVHIADEAEFTPRNVQTVQGRKNTVYAVKLQLSNPTMELKPGMPADVNLDIE